eukprot:GHRR01024534.1.p1 GENE.GHRR01024534.1~~GHRR01024534.1.p1  ORF type:complete len:173 (+),score=67.55 GHRR01024534.1:1649-2167(+)
MVHIAAGIQPCIARMLGWSACMQAVLRAYVKCCWQHVDYFVYCDRAADMSQVAESGMATMHRFACWALLTADTEGSFITDRLIDMATAAVDRVQAHPSAAPLPAATAATGDQRQQGARVSRQHHSEIISQHIASALDPRWALPSVPTHTSQAAIPNSAELQTAQLVCFSDAI